MSANAENQNPKAHRADELWQEGDPSRGSDLAYWMRAEREVMERRFPGLRQPVRV